MGRNDENRKKKKNSALGKHLILVSDKTSMDATISTQKFKLKQDIYIIYIVPKFLFQNVFKQ